MSASPDHVESGRYIGYIRKVEGLEVVDPADPLYALILAAARQELRNRGSVIPDPATYEVQPSADALGRLFLRVVQYDDDADGPQADTSLVVMQGKEDGLLKLVPSDTAVDGMYNVGYSFAGLTPDHAAPLFQIADELGWDQRRN